MAKCSNCGATMSCGCQRRISSDGKQGCTKCIDNKTKPAKSASVHRVENNNYSSPIPVVNSAKITNTDK